MCSQFKYFIAALVVSTGTSLAQDRKNDPLSLIKDVVTFEHIPSPDFGRINSIIRDDRGFLWFGTTKGLCKYDGYQVRLFLRQPAWGGGVFAVENMGTDSLVLGTSRGLLAFALATEQAVPFLAGMDFSEGRITALARDHAGTLWIGTGAYGLVSYDPSTRTTQRYTTGNGLGDDRITTLLVGRSDAVWIGTVAGGLNVLDRRTSRIVQYRRRMTNAGWLNSDHVTALCENGSGELWIGTNDGLNVLDLGTGHAHPMPHFAYAGHNIAPITHDLSGRMWVAVSDLGLLSYSHGEFIPFTTSGDVERSLSSIMSLYPDPVATTGKSLLLWVGTHSGVDKVLISANPFANHIRGEDSLTLDRGAVLSLHEDRKGVLWTGLWGGGLDGFQRTHGAYRRITHLHHEPANPLSLPTNDVSDIIEDRDGNLWTGTSGGVAMLDADRKRMIIDRHVDGDSTSLVNNTVTRVYEDRSHTIWICTLGGLSQLIPGKPHRFKNYLDRPADAHALGGNEVEDILQDSLSNLWVGTYGRGLVKLEADGTIARFTFPGDSSGTHENWIYGMVEDHHGLFWLSTHSGLVSFDPRSRIFARHAIDQLYDAHIFGIAVDRKDDLWLSTGIGLARFSPMTRTFVRYDRDDGILFTELRSGFFLSSRGTLFAGGLDGFVEFCPDNITTTNVPPPVVITGLSIFDRAMPAERFAAPRISLSYDQNFFSFSFAALDYADPKRNSYAYRMVGLDADWINAGHRTYATYTNLDPGEYVFEVKGSNSDNVWNETGTSMRVTISPPYWRTWWFRSVVVVLGLTVIYGAYRYRLMKLLDLERLRLRIANDLHDDVGSNLSAIAMVSRTLHHAPELSAGTKRKLTEIYDTAILTSEGMRDLVWLIKPENDTLDDLFLRMKDTASTLLGEISFDFHDPDVPESKTIGIDFKRSVFLAFKEIITNVAKHSQASTVHILISLRDGLFEMVVRDNGKGFDTKTHKRGNGLQSLRKRAEHVGGSCTVTSESGRGTTVTFSATI